MAKKFHFVARESRWLFIAVAIAAVTHASSAQASSKLLNNKMLLRDSVTCAAALPGASVVSIDRSRMILGGAPSALDLIRITQQNGASDASLVPAAPTLIPAKFGDRSAEAALEPAGRNPVSISSPPSCDAEDAFRNRPLQSIFDHFQAMGTEGDPAAELGTRAIPVKRTRFDDRWDRVRRAAPAALMQGQLRRANAEPSLGEQDLLARVNQWVNRKIAYVNDDRNYRRADFWATAEQTIARGSGDCEDFAILKMQLLQAAGVSADRMKLVLLRDLAANSDHAFLLVQTAAGKVVLDNTTDRLYDGSQSNSVRPVLSFSENRRWVHAYRGQRPSPNLAALPASQKSAVLALNNQRSVNAELLTFKTGFSK